MTAKGIDPLLSVALAKALEKGINTALLYDPGTRLKLNKLYDCVIQFECSSPKLSFFFEIDKKNNSVLVSSYSENNITTKVSGSLFDILVLLASSEGIGSASGINSLANSGLSILGNSARLSKLQNMMQGIDIDWEQAFIDITSPLGESGNVISHQAATTIKHFLAWIKKSRITFNKNIAAYLSEELRAIPAKPEFETFYEGVSTLRSDVDRLQAKIDAFILSAHSP